MPIPNLLHKTRIVIRQQNQSGTVYDEDAREAIQLVKKDNDLVLVGQVKMKGDVNQTYHTRGVSEEGLGYILFRQFDLDHLNVELKPNDQVVQMGHREVDLWIERIEPTAHYADTNGSSLIKAHLTDRKPSRNNPGE